MEIEIRKISSFPIAEFNVTIIDKTMTIHNVLLDEDFYTWLTGKKILPEELIKKSFYFLLQRESQGLIMNNFNLSVINKYFPDFKMENLN